MTDLAVRPSDTKTGDEDLNHLVCCNEPRTKTACGMKLDADESIELDLTADINCVVCYDALGGAICPETNKRCPYVGHVSELSA